MPPKRSSGKLKWLWLTEHPEVTSGQSKIRPAHPAQLKQTDRVADVLGTIGRRIGWTELSHNGFAPTAVKNTDRSDSDKGIEIIRPTEETAHRRKVASV